MAKKVLVFPSLSEIGEEIVRALNHNKEFELVLGSTKKHDTKCIYLPYIYDKDFKKELIKVLNLHSIDIIYPAHDLFIDWISANRSDIPAKIVLDTCNTIDLVRSKSATYKFFNGAISVPEMYSTKTIQLTSLKLPLFVKPDRGYGSLDTQIIDNEKELTKYIGNNDFVITEYLPGKEYTVDCISDIYGNLLTSYVRERKEIRNGICKSTSYVNNSSDFIETAKK